MQGEKKNNRTMLFHVSCPSLIALLLGTANQTYKLSSVTYHVG